MSAIKVFSFCLGLIHSGKTAQHLSVIVFRGISGFLLIRAGFVPGKAKKGGKHRNGALTDDMGLVLVSSKKRRQLAALSCLITEMPLPSRTVR